MTKFTEEDRQFLAIQGIGETPEQTVDRFAGYRADDFQRELDERDQCIHALTVLHVEQTVRGDRWRTGFYSLVGVIALTVLWMVTR